MVGITWKTGNPSIKVNAEASDYTISEYGDDLLRYVQVLFDATPTQSTYNLAYRNNKFVTYNGSADNAMYTIYGGYTIEYSLASNVLTAKIYSYWYDKSTNNISAVNTFTVALKENKTNAKDKYYPRDNYYIRDLKIFEVDTITTTNNIIDNNLDMNSGTSIINGNTITVRSTSYDGNKKVYVVKFDEYIHAVDLSYNITYAGSTSTSLSTDLAYIEAEKIDGNAVTQNITGAITTINNISNNEATGYIQYDMIKGGIYLSISDRFAGTIVPSNSKAMREVKSFSRSQVRFDRRPYRHYGCIRQQAHNDSTFLTSLLNAKQCFTRHPSVSNCLLISLTRTLSNDYIETIIAQIARLSRSLYTITDHCNCFIFQNFTCFFQRKFFAGHYVLSNTAKIQLCHFLF